MSIPRKWWKAVLAAIAVVFVLQLAASLLVRTRTVHAYLTARLSREFGRPVEVRSFEAQLLPAPRLDASSISIGEDPAFGNEYFLRAEELSAGLRWTGFLRGRFELGTLSISRPSLILVRNAAHRWNLESWLPPARSTNTATHTYGPPAPAPPGNRLQKIEFDDGRVNFKEGNDKQPFAFTNVSGSVEQVAPGRWQLQLEATPWRSGVLLQSTGTVHVRGDLAGTSARLQPAEVQVRWENASLADLFRLWKGQDFGVRGTFALDGTLKSLGLASAAANVMPRNAWSFSVQARAGQVHRWDLTERSDNPALNLKLEGRVYSDDFSVQPADFAVEGRLSNVHGRFSIGGESEAGLRVDAESMGIQAADLLAWYRAFHPGVEDGVSAKQFFTGAFTVSGWPPRLESAGFSSLGGEIAIPGVASRVQIGPVAGGERNGQLKLEPVRVLWERQEAPAKAAGKAGKRRAAETAGTLDLGLVEDFAARAGAISIGGRTDAIADVLRIAQALGHPVQHGWELNGAATAALRWEWKDGSSNGKWNGRVGVSNAELQAAGLNQPLLFENAQIEYRDGKRSVQVGKAEGFGAAWDGEIAEAKGASGGDHPRWEFRLHADQLDAAELDRWVGPRGRPNWLQRLLSSLVGSGSASSAAAASDLVRSVDAEGELRIDSLRIEKFQLQNVRAQGSLRDLRLQVDDVQAELAGGQVRGKLKAQFLPRPAYELAADLDRVNLTQLPGGIVPRLSGSTSGKLLLSMQGVGREELLRTLSGRGEISAKNIELRGWDVGASFADGVAHSGISRWTTGKGAFLLRDRTVLLEDLRLDGARESTFVNGKISFARDADLEIESSEAGKRVNVTGSGRVLRISGPLDGPRVSVENAVARQPAD